MISLVRHEGPIFSPDDKYPWEAQGTFNPGVVRVGTETVMLYRTVGELDSYISRFGLAKSSDGINFVRASAEPVFTPHESFDLWGAEDPRIVAIDDDYYVTYVAVPERIMLDGASFPRTTPLTTSGALLRTKDFITYDNLGIITPVGSDNKDVVLFPKRINGRYVMLHRPHYWSKSNYKAVAAGETLIELPCAPADLPAKPSVWIAWSEDLVHWTDHTVLMVSDAHDTKIGPGLPPIETADGWLVIYHHVEATERPDGFNYSARAALFALDDPTRCIGKIDYDILAPERAYEKERNSHIVFPTGGYVEDDTLYVYYGASDRYVCLATTSISALLQELTTTP